MGTGCCLLDVDCHPQRNNDHLLREGAVMLAAIVFNSLLFCLFLWMGTQLIWAAWETYATFRTARQYTALLKAIAEVNARMVRQQASLTLSPNEYRRLD